MKRDKRLNREYAKSMCRCGHVGDGKHSEHANAIALGHGACNECGCLRFSWARWLTAQEQTDYLTSLPVQPD